MAEYAAPRRPSPDPNRPIDSTVLGHRLKALYKRPGTVDAVVYRIEHAPGRRAGVQRWRVAERSSWHETPDDEEESGDL